MNFYIRGKRKREKIEIIFNLCIVKKILTTNVSRDFRDFEINLNTYMYKNLDTKVRNLI